MKHPATWKHLTMAVRRYFCHRVSWRGQFNLFDGATTPYHLEYDMFTLYFQSHPAPSINIPAPTRLFESRVSRLALWHAIHQIQEEMAGVCRIPNHLKEVCTKRIRVD